MSGKSEATYASKTTLNKTSSKYVKKGPKNYQKWINEHKEEILNIDSKNRVDYVQEHLNNDLNLNKTKNVIYQLLYRNKLIDKKKKDSNSSSDEVSPKRTNNINIPMTISDITSQLSALAKSDYNPEFINETISRYIIIMNKINEDFEELINFKNELKNFI